MKNAFRFSIALLFVCATACAAPRMKQLDSSGSYSRRPAGFPIDVYNGRVIETHRRIAIIESAAYPTDDEETRRRQLEQLKDRARVLGADAVEDLHILQKRIKGAAVDEATPFIALRQGRYNLFFLRGTAIVYETSLPGAVGPGKGFTTGPEGFRRPERDKAKKPKPAAKPAETPAAASAPVVTEGTAPVAPETPAVPVEEMLTGETQPVPEVAPPPTVPDAENVPAPVELPR